MREGRRCPWICNTSLLGLVQACLPDQLGQAWSVWTWFRADPWQGLLWAWILGMVVGRQWLLWQGFLWFSPGSRKKGDYTTEWGPKQSTPSSPMKRRNSLASPKATVAPRVLFYPLPLPPTEWPLILNGIVIFPVSQSIWSFLGFFSQEWCAGGVITHSFFLNMQRMSSVITLHEL